MKKYYALIASLFISMNAFAANLGTIASGIAVPINAARAAFNGGAYVIGAGFLIGAFFRYMRFRQNPQEAPISSVIVLFLIGIVLVILPFAFSLSHGLATAQGMGDVLPTNS